MVRCMRNLMIAGGITLGALLSGCNAETGQKNPANIDAVVEEVKEINKTTDEAIKQIMKGSEDLEKTTKKLTENIVKPYQDAEKAQKEYEAKTDAYIAMEPEARYQHGLKLLMRNPEAVKKYKITQEDGTVKISVYRDVLRQGKFEKAEIRGRAGSIAELKEFDLGRDTIVRIEVRGFVDKALEKARGDLIGEHPKSAYGTQDITSWMKGEGKAFAQDYNVAEETTKR